MSNYSVANNIHGIKEKIENGITILYDEYEYEVGDIVLTAPHVWYMYSNLSGYKTANNEVLFVISSKEKPIESSSHMIRDRRYSYKIVALENPRIILDYLRYEELIPLKVNKDQQFYLFDC